jgi:hypothetical protein
MKKIILCSLFLLIISSVSAQIFQLGPRFGVSSSNIKIKEVTNSNLQTISQSDARLGFHAGVYARIMVLGFYVQPEVLFVSTSSDVTISSASGSAVSSLSFAKLDVPVLVGKRFLGIARVNAGPVFSQLLTADVRQGGLTEDIASQYAKSSVGYQIGVGADIWKLRLDLKYEGSFGAIADNISIRGQSFPTDTRPRQFIASVGWRLL